MRRLLITSCILAAVVACGDHPVGRRAGYAAADSAGAGQPRADRRIGFDAQGRPLPTSLDEVTVTGVASELPPVTPTDVAANMIIRTATASIEVDSLEPAVAMVHQLAERVGGYVGGQGVETGRNQLRQAFIEVKIPAARFNEVIGGLKPIGKLESVNVAAQDVGEEFVDVTARMDNARRLERRLIDLLATRTGKLKDVLDVEQSLAQVREEIERYEGRIRYMQAHIAMSTLNVTLHEPLPVVGTAGRSVLGEAFAQAWRNFVGFISVLVQSLGVILPLAMIGGLVWFVTRRLRASGAQRAV